MSPGGLTQDSVLATAEQDFSLSARDDHFAILGQIVQWSEVDIPADRE
jgi:hypothetical protein